MCAITRSELCRCCVRTVYHRTRMRRPGGHEALLVVVVVVVPRLFLTKTEISAIIAIVAVAVVCGMHST